MPKNLTAISMILISVLLSACSSRPTDDDLRKATIKSLEQIGGKDGVATWQTEINAMRVLSCKQDDKAYLCDIQGVTGPEQVRMIKADDGWLVIQQKQ
ncbi:hypothetical protein NHH82_12340 [Oxalobacteraceae bacterium OTU3REALA1]|nr:hypothetical protein NHH82_12340 [Oxalobacteraceae bacterium OTU3REALA1]